MFYSLERILTNQYFLAKSVLVDALTSFYTPDVPKGMFFGKSSSGQEVDLGYHLIFLGNPTTEIKDLVKEFINSSLALHGSHTSHNL